MLAYDIHRCAGIGTEQICERRDDCARYIALKTGDMGPFGSPCFSFLCKDGQDLFIEYVGEAVKS